MLLNVKLAICVGMTTNLGDRPTHLLVIICASVKSPPRVKLQRGAFTSKFLASQASYGSLHRTLPLLPSQPSDDYMDSSSDDELDPCDDYSAVAGIPGTSPSMGT